jgi:hypothetical protein
VQRPIVVKPVIYYRSTMSQFQLFRNDIPINSYRVDRGWIYPRLATWNLSCGWRLSRTQLQKVSYFEDGHRSIRPTVHFCIMKYTYMIIYKVSFALLRSKQFTELGIYFLGNYCHCPQILYRGFQICCPCLRPAQPAGLTDRFSAVFPLFTWWWKQNPAFDTS